MRISCTGHYLYQLTSFGPVENIFKVSDARIAHGGHTAKELMRQWYSKLPLLTVQRMS
jgi:hypothetical protein